MHAHTRSATALMGHDVLRHTRTHTRTRRPTLSRKEEEKSGLSSRIEEAVFPREADRAKIAGQRDSFLTFPRRSLQIKWRKERVLERRKKKAPFYSK